MYDITFNRSAHNICYDLSPLSYFRLLHTICSEKDEAIRLLLWQKALNALIPRCPLRKFLELQGLKYDFPTEKVGLPLFVDFATRPVRSLNWNKECTLRKKPSVIFLFALQDSVVNNLNIAIGCQLWSWCKERIYRKSPTEGEPINAQVHIF